MNIVYIVDGGKEMGLGHIYQSISFGEILKSYAEITFLTKSEIHIANKIASAGFNVLRMLDDCEIFNFIKSKQPEIVIFDKIDVSDKLASEIKRLGKIKLVIFTNLTNANKYADIAITAGIGSNFKNIRYIDKETHTLYLYGPKYWVLREDFNQYKEKKKEIHDTVKDILIIFGGSDPANLTTCTVRELLSQSFNYNIKVVLGAGFNYINDFNKVLSESMKKDSQILVLRDISNVAELMHSADLVIASPGLSTYEALYVGTPILLLPQNELQKKTYQGFFKMIDSNDISILPERIERCDFTYPYQEEIVDMDIAGGLNEMIKEIVGYIK
jgi:spore coat polysaccharide biosynthesis predicted glycosyltransferase SpsG